jgi:hypothetical protein
MAEIQSILLCTSPLQLLVTKVITDWLSDQDRQNRTVTVVVVHPLLMRVSSGGIAKLSQQLFGTSPIDVSEYYPDRSAGKYDDVSGLELSKEAEAFRDESTRHKGVSPAVRARELVNRYRKSASVAQRKVSGRVPIIHEVYCRHRPRLVDQFFISAVVGKQSPYFFGIEDGIGNYEGRIQLTEADWWIHKVRQACIRAAKCLFVSILSSDYQCSRDIFFPKRIRWKKTFPETAICGTPQLEEGLRSTCWELQRRSEGYSSVKVVILGSLLVHQKTGFTEDEEITLYNRWIEKIAKRHQVKSDEIWYKPHPRLSSAAFVSKRVNLKCKMYPMEPLTLAELEVSRPSVKAVYSIGSTGLLYSRVIFGKEAYLIDLGRYKKISHRDSNLYRYVAKKYGIPVLEW